MNIIQGIDNKETRINRYLTGLYYYIIDKNDIDNNNADYLGLTSVIENICYNPFLSKGDVSINVVPFDSQKYQGTSTSIKVNRIYAFNQVIKTIGTYDIDSKYNSYNSSYESKLLLYPFRYYILTDYINPPLLIKPQLMYRVDGKWQFNVNISLSQESKYCIYPFYYKSDSYGNIEGIINNNPLLFPVTSNQYSNFLVSQGNSINASKQLALIENDITLQQGTTVNKVDTTSSIIGGILKAITGNLGGGLTQVAQGSLHGGLNQGFMQVNHNFKEYQIETEYLARKQDYINTPRAIKTVGNDAIFNIEQAQKKVDLIEFGLTPQRETRISEYFKKYGNKVNDYGIPNIKSREEFNFIKTINCNIDSDVIPHADILKIQEIFNSGITFWHVDRGGNVKNYTGLNREL